MQTLPIGTPLYSFFDKTIEEMISDDYAFFFLSDFHEALIMFQRSNPNKECVIKVFNVISDIDCFIGNVEDRPNQKISNIEFDECGKYLVRLFDEDDYLKIQEVGQYSFPPSSNLENKKRKRN